MVPASRQLPKAVDWNLSEAGGLFYEKILEGKDRLLMTKEGDFKIRFRHTSGDLGPLIFTKDTTVTQVKERLLTEWPVEGPFASDAPGSISEIKLILGGKYADDGKALFDYRRELGDFNKDTAATMHLVVQKAGLAKGSGKGDRPMEKCCCAIQ